MALNAGGVGITFEGRDRGFLGLVSNATSELGRMAGAGVSSIADFTRGTGSWLGKLGFYFIGAKMAFQGFFALFDPLINGVKSLFGAFDPSALMETAGQLGEVTNLTSNLEAEAVSTGKSAREMGAQMGYTGDQLDKFTKKATSMAMALNVGPDEAAKALRAWDEATSEMRALGISNVEDLVKFTSAFGVEADQLRNSTLMMRKEFGLTDEQINNVIGSTIEMGRATGDVPAALNEMSQHMERMRENARGMGVELDAKKLANFAAQTNALASGLFQMGQDSDTARSAAAELSDALVNAEKDFHNMFAGTQQEMPEFIKQLAITTGDAESAFKLMEAGPAGFVKGMAQMVATAKDQGTLTSKNLDFVGARMEQVLGAEAAARLVGFMRTADANTIRVMGNIENATANLGAMAKEAFRTGRTSQEAFERMMMSVGDLFRRAGKKEVREWASNVREGVKMARTKIGELAADKGPLGEFTRKLAAAEHIGAQAFLPPSLQQGSIVLGQFSKQLGPVIEGMKQLGIEFSIGGLIKSAALSVSLFATQVALSRKENESWGSAIKRTADTIADEMVASIEKWGGVLGQVAEGFANYDWGNLFSGLTATMNDTDVGPIGKIRKAFSKVFDSDTINNLYEGWNKIWEAIDNSGVIEKVKSTWDMIVQDVIKPAMISMLEFVLEEVPWGDIGKAIVTGIGGGIGDALSDVGKGMAKHFFWTDEDAMMEANTKLMQERNKETATEITAMKKRLADLKAAEEQAAMDRALAIAAEQSKMTEGMVNYGEKVNEVMDQTHGSSVHTFVEEDMDKALAAIENVTTEFERLWNEAWVNVLDDMDIAVGAIETSAAGVLTKLQQISQAKDDIMESRGGLPDTPGAATERDLRIRAAVGDQAVHAPEWYRGSTGYENLFTRKMDRLIAGVERMGVQKMSEAPSPAVVAREQLQARATARRGTGGATTPATRRSGAKSRR